eukprot:3932722-Rhodomonas_salina.1
MELEEERQRARAEGLRAATQIAQLSVAEVCAAADTDRSWFNGDAERMVRRWRAGRKCCSATTLLWYRRVT